MKVTLTFLIGLLPIFLSAQLRERNSFNDWELMNLKGNIKEIKERVYEVNVKNNNNHIFDNGFLVPANFNYYFDTTGYLIFKEGIKEFEGKEIAATKQIFEFKENKLLTDLYIITEFHDYDTIKYRYKYPNDSVTIRSTISKNYNGLTQKIKQQGILEFTELYYPGEEILESKTVKYNSNNKIVFKETKGFGDNEIIIRDYDKLSKCEDFQSETLISSKYKIHSIEYREYDKYCNVTKKNFTNKNSETLTLISHYSYDPSGNWIEKKSYNSKGEIYSVTKRQITYYQK